MKNTKQFFAVFLSVIICILVVFAVTYATTTISTNIVTGGTVAISGADSTAELDVRGTASVSEDIWASGSFQFGAGDATGTLSYSRLGSGTTGHSLGDADDLLITGLLEVNDIAYFDSDVAIKGTAAPATEFSVLGTVSISEDLWASGSFQFGGGEAEATTSYSRLGGADTGHSLASASDLLISNTLEVDGTAWFDGAVSVSSSGLILDGGASITTGATSPSAACIMGSLYIDTVLGTISICDVNLDWSPITIQ